MLLNVLLSFQELYAENFTTVQQFLLVSCETSMSTVQFEYNAVSYTTSYSCYTVHRHVAAYDADNKVLNTWHFMSCAAIWLRADFN